MDAERTLVVSSGMAALDVITRLLKSGDEVIAGDDLYGGNCINRSTANDGRYQSALEVSENAP
jgi:cystathionine beta-lyase/cystathionine gamma-synthase